MSPTIMAFIMLVIIIGFVFYKKVPMPFVLAIVPIVCALILGTPLKDLSGYILGSANNIMQSSGYMLLFALMYFTLLTETGMFDILVDNIMKLLKGNINVWIVMILTTVIATIGGLTASISAAYFITFPIMMPLYKKINFDKKSAMVIAQTAISAMCFVPWGIGIAMTASFANVDTLELAAKAMPIALCFIPAIILQWMYFALRHKKMSAGNINGEGEIAATIVEEEKKKVNPNARPQLFWINFIIFIASLVALGYFKVPTYMVFIFSTLLTTLINYPNAEQYQPLWQKCSVPFFNTLLMLIGISVFVGVFNETGMLEGVSNTVISVFPPILTRYMHLILLAICVIVLRFIPYQMYNSLYPLLIGVGATCGISPIMVMAPYVCNLALGTGSSPMNPGTHIGVNVLEIDMDEYVSHAVPIQTATNIFIIGLGMLLGVII